MYRKQIDNAIEKAIAGYSKLTPEILALEGMSSARNRHLLNNLLEEPQTNYLEIGVWKGSTFIAALYGNRLNSAVAIDNWSEFNGPKQQFLDNCARFVDQPYQFLECDSFQADKSQINNPVNIYFYDGCHEEVSQFRSLEYFADVLADQFIFMVDDWEWAQVQQGTRRALEQLPFEVEYEQQLSTYGQVNPQTWWNGLYIASLKKVRQPSMQVPPLPFLPDNQRLDQPHPAATLNTKSPVVAENETLIVQAVREQMIEALPQQAVVAEIGVAEGDFSQSILDRTQPEQLHLIDLWEHHEDANYDPDPANLPDAAQQGRFEQVITRFADLAIEGRVVVYRNFSTKAASLFPKQFFDWVYVDAMHTYQAVLEDLHAYYDLVQSDGFLCGHDYANHQMARQMNFGVVEAVNQFARETGCKFVALNIEAYPSYILAKDPQSERCKQLESTLIERFTTERIVDFLQQEFIMESNQNKCQMHIR